uniref:Receptor ligand binding region domain-containing protein n=1 Tax=Amphimedon queenslandica TaxID=400682 RepID=A0A1X7SXB8_AMPQE
MAMYSFPKTSVRKLMTSGVYLSNYTDLLMNEPVYENLTALGLSGVAFDGVWAIAVALDIASKKILLRNETGCENVPGDLVPLEQFNYTNMKLGCILRQSFSEVNFLGVTGQIRFNRFGSRNDNVILYQQYRVINGILTKVSIGAVTVELHRNTFVFETGESDSTLWNSALFYFNFMVVNIILF